jgi:hypothetical protein
LRTMYINKHKKKLLTITKNKTGQIKKHV